MPTYYLHNNECWPLIPTLPNNEVKLQHITARSQGLNNVINSILDVYYRQPFPDWVIDESNHHQSFKKINDRSNCSGIYKTYPERPDSRLHKPKRGVHGALHAARVAALVRRFHSINQKHGSVDRAMLDKAAQGFGLQNHEQLIQLTQVAAAFHDSARLDEGKDYWDKDSSENCHHFLEQHGVDSELAKLLQQALQHKDHFRAFQDYLTNKGYDQDGQTVFKYLRQLIKDSDTLEVMRARREFDISQLQSYKHGSSNRRKDIQSLVAEHQALLYEHQDIRQRIAVKDSSQNQSINLDVTLPNKQANKNQLEYDPQLFSQLDKRINHTKAYDNSYGQLMQNQRPGQGSQNENFGSHDSTLNLQPSGDDCSLSEGQALSNQRQQLYTQLLEKHYHVRPSTGGNYEVELEVGESSKQTHTYEIKTNHSDQQTKRMLPEVSTSIPCDMDKSFYQDLVQKGMTLIQDCLQNTGQSNALEIDYQPADAQSGMSEELADAIVEAAEYKQVLDKINSNDTTLNQKIDQKRQGQHLDQSPSPQSSQQQGSQQSYQTDLQSYQPPTYTSGQ